MAVWLIWMDHHPIHQKFAGSVPDQGTCLGCGFHPGWGMHRRHPTMSLSLSLSLSLCLSLKSINISSGED